MFSLILKAKNVATVILAGGDVWTIYSWIFGQRIDTQVSESISTKLCFYATEPQSLLVGL